MADGFSSPDLSAPVDLVDRLGRIPIGATVKGMFLQSLCEEARAVAGRSAGRERYTAYRDYPLREWLEVLVATAELVHPRLPVREGMRRLGQKAYPTFKQSTVGKVVMAVAGASFVAALRQVHRIYAVSGNAGTADVAEITEGRAIVLLRDSWDFPDAWHVGVFEGGMRGFDKIGMVRVRNHSQCDADLELTWR